MRSILIPLAFVLAGCQLPVPASAPASVNQATAAQISLVQALEVEALRRELAAHPFVYQASEVEPVAIDLLVRVNRLRQSQGRPPLVASAQLMELAGLRVRDLVANEYAAHVHPRRGTLEAERLLRAAGVEGLVAELLFGGSSDLGAVAEAAITGWAEDSANRPLLLAQSYRYAGAGVMGDPDETLVVLLVAENQP